MEETDEHRIRKLEIKLARLIAGGIVAVVAILAFIGVTKWYQIPTQVRTAVSDAISKSVEEELPRFGERLERFLTETEEAAERAKEHASEIDGLAQALRSRNVQIQTGIVEIDKDGDPDVFKLDYSCGPYSQAPIRYRGTRGKRVDFPTLFASTPEVFMALSYIDAKSREFAGTSRLGIKTQITHVDTRGFNYDFVVWCQTGLRRGEASWIAVAR